MLDNDFYFIRRGYFHCHEKRISRCYSCPIIACYETNSQMGFRRPNISNLLNSSLCSRSVSSPAEKKHQEAGSASALTLDASGTSLEVPDVLPPQPQITCRMSPTRASWLFVSQLAKLDEKQKQHVNAIRKGHPDLETAYHLSQDFVMMLAERRADDLDTWLTQAERSGLPEFKKLVKGIRQDYAAVRAAFPSQWSNGQVEAQVNCLKLQKRLVFCCVWSSLSAVSHDPALNPSMTSHHASRTSKQAGTH